MSSCCLLVVAHPDDESMFFGPSIASLQGRGARIHVLCMSTGNADGLGAVRRQELIRACQLLGVPKKDVTIVDDPQLQDGMDQAWNTDLIVNHVAAVAAAVQAHTIITFDAAGVSGHPNHRAVCHGVCSFVHQQQRQHERQQQWQQQQKCSTSKQEHQTQRGGSRRLQVQQLLSVGLLPKYCVFVGLLLGLFAAALRPNTQICINWHPWRCWAALLAHNSQMVWYRKLWMFCSSYMYFNVLTRLSTVS